MRPEPRNPGETSRRLSLPRAERGCVPSWWDLESKVRAQKELPNSLRGRALQIPTKLAPSFYCYVTNLPRQWSIRYQHMLLSLLVARAPLQPDLLCSWLLGSSQRSCWRLVRSHDWCLGWEEPSSWGLAASIPLIALSASGWSLCLWVVSPHDPSSVEAQV